MCPFRLFAQTCSQATQVGQLPFVLNGRVEAFERATETFERELLKIALVLRSQFLNDLNYLPHSFRLALAIAKTPY